MKKIKNDFGKLNIDNLVEVLAELIDRVEKLEKKHEDVPIVNKKVTKKKVVKKGDVNGDGKVDEKDLSIVHKEYSEEVKKNKE